MKQKYTLILFLTLSITIIVSIFTLLNKPPVHPSPRVADGVIDLQNWSFEKNGPVSLEGEWSFYFNKFLAHEDFQNGIPSDVHYVSVPSTRGSTNKVKPFKNNQYYGTLRLVIKLPQTHEVYGVRSDFVLSAYKLFIDGTYYGEVGKVGKDAVSSRPYYNIMNAYFYPQSNELEIIYHTSDFTFGDCAISPPIFGLSNQIASVSKFGVSRDFFLFGIFIIMGIYHLGLYYIRRKDPAPFFYGLFCLSFALRLMVVGERFLPSVWNISYIVYDKIAYGSVFVGFFALCSFINYSFPVFFKPWFNKISLTCIISAFFLSVFLPFLWLDYLLVIYAVIGFSLMGIAILKLIYGVWTGVPFSSGVLVGYGVLLIAFINDLLYDVTFLNHSSMIPFGVTVFTFTQAYTLSSRFSNAFSEAERLSEENVSILVELKNMNANLESIVDERTSDLKNALQEMDIMSKIDYLTKLPNRRLMFQNIDKLVEEKRNFFIALADIDKFKIVNDTFGHDKGDEILKGASAAMMSSIENKGFVGRWGGEEFLLVLFSEDPVEALEIAKCVCDSVANCRYETVDAKITLTMGLCYFSAGQTVDTCIANADNALYIGKANGRNQCHMYGTI